MDAYACQHYVLQAGSHVLHVFVAKRGQLTALATAGTSDIVMTKHIQAGIILPTEADVTGWSHCFPREVQHLLRLECSAFLRDSNSICFAQQTTVRCFLLHTGRPGIGNTPHRSALTGRVLAAPECAPPVSAVSPPPWSCAVAGHGAGREAALPPSPFQAPMPSQPRAFMPGAPPPRPPAPPIPLRTGGHRSSEGSREADPLFSSAPPPSAPAEADIPSWLEHKSTCPHALAETARDVIRQLHAWNADRPPAQEDASDITQALETDQNFPEPTPDGILPLRAAVGSVTGEPPDPQGWHPAVDYLALLNCLLPQLRDAEHAGAHVLLLVTDSRNFLSIPHFPYFIRHLVARMQWEGTYREKWFPIFGNTREAGLAAVHFT